MPEIEASEKRQGLHLACFPSTAIESKENFLARTPKMPAKCESQASGNNSAKANMTNLCLFHMDRETLDGASAQRSFVAEVAFNTS